MAAELGHRNCFFEFEWDASNSLKILKKHDVSMDEVEDVFMSEFKLVLGRQYQPDVPEERYCIVGETSKGRVVSVVFCLRDGRVRPVSARPASRKERMIYEKSR